MATRLVLTTFALSLLMLLQFASDRIESVKFTDCNSGKKADAILEAVKVEGCGDSDSVCPFKRGNNASIEVNFKTTSSFNSAIVHVYGIFKVMPIPFIISPDNACGNYGFNCPVGPNEEKRLKISLPILRAYPKLALDAKLYLNDEKQQPIICVEFPIKIVDA